MIEEELKQEAEKSLDKRLGTYAYIRKQDCYTNYVDGYIDGAEPREKRIAELEATCNKWFEHLKNREEELLNELNNQNAKYNKQIEELEKENAELIHENARLVTVIDKSKGCGISPLNYLIIKNLNDQLTKAKDHIKKLLDCLKQDTNDPQTNYYVCQYMDKAEQFLSEVDK
jgi:hypothetical protein